MNARHNATHAGTAQRPRISRPLARWHGTYGALTGRKASSEAGSCPAPSSVRKDDAEVACAEGVCERSMGGAGPDHERPRRIDVVRTCERERQARERRAAPALRRAASVRAERGLDGSRDRLGKSSGACDEPVAAAVVVPVEDEVWRRRIALRE